MIAVEHMDYGALKLVKGEIDVNLMRAHDVLGEFRRNTEDTSQIKLCIILLHQVHGALRVLDFTWASVLTGVMERMAHVLSESPAKRTDWAYDTLTRSIEQLPGYLNKLQEGEVTPPLEFIPLLNDLRVACGGSILSEAMIFSQENPMAVIAPIDSKENNYNVIDVRALAGKLRPVYQAALLVWYRDVHNKAALRRIMEVIVQLQQSSPSEGLWCAAGEVIEKLLAGDLDSTTSVKLLLGQVERLIRRVMESGPEDLFSNPPTDVIKNLIYYISFAENRIELSSEISSNQQDSHTSYNIDGSKSALLNMAAKAVKDELSWAKRKLDDFAQSNGRHTSNELYSIMDVLRRVSDTLDMLGRWELRQRVRRQAGILGSILNEESILNDPRIMEVANALLYVESLLGDKQSQIKSLVKESSNDVHHHYQAMREEEYHELCRAIVREVMVDITQVKDDIIAFSKDPDQCELLNSVPRLMHRIIGALTMLSLRRPTIVLKAIYHYISHEILKMRIVPTQEAMDIMADVLTSVEYFLETMIESQMNLDSLLDMAEGNITALGYLVDRVDEIVVDVGIKNMLDDGDITINEEKIDLPSLKDEPFIGEEISIPAVILVDEYTEYASDSIKNIPSDSDVNPKKNTGVMDGQNEDVVDEIIEIFVEEAVEAIEIINENYPKWKENRSDTESLKTFRRSFHTLKGSGRLVGANIVGELSWAVETLLNKIIEGEVEATPAIDGYIEECLSIIPGLVQKFNVEKIKTEISDDIQALIDKSTSIVGIHEVTLESDSSIPQVDIEPLSVLDIQEESIDKMAVDDLISVSDLDQSTRNKSIEDIPYVGHMEYPEVDNIVIEEEAPVVDMVLLEIFTNESTWRLKEIREFTSHCYKSNKKDITESLLRNLHTLHGSSHMAGFTEIAGICAVFDRHFKVASQIQRDVTDDELSLLIDLVNLIEEFLCAKCSLNKILKIDSFMARYDTLIARIQGLSDANKINHIAAPEEIVVEDLVAESVHNPVQEIVLADLADVDKEHEEIVFQVFMEEAAEILENTEAILNQWINAPGIMEPMVRLERELHTFKGGARMAGIVPMGDLSHSVESLLSSIVSGGIGITDEIIQILQQSHDQLHQMLEQALHRIAVTPAAELISRLEALANNSEITHVVGIEPVFQDVITKENILPVYQDLVIVDSVDSVDSVDLEVIPVVFDIPHKFNENPVSNDTYLLNSEQEVTSEKTLKDQVRIKADVLDNLVNQAGELSISRTRLEQQINMLRFGLNEMKQTVDRLRDKIRHLDIETEAQILFRYQEVSNQGEEFDPLEFDRFSLVQQLSRGMMEGTSDLSSIQDQFEKQVEDAEVLLLQQANINTELQEIMIGTRLLPFSSVSNRIKRLVRQISRETGKVIDFDVIGDNVEMDRTVLDKITAPLEHMIRNAIDHGIEDLSKRRSLGKPDKGRISLSLTKEGVEMVLKMQDDGAGFNLQAIRRTAIERGLVTENQMVDDQMLIQFSLEAGFSTAAKVTQISGRGVGMDVVNNEIKQLGGSLHIDSKPDQGSTFTIRFPVALSVARALVVKEYSQEYAILNSNIAGVMRVDHPTLMRAYDEPAPVLEYASENYPIHLLHRFLSGEESTLPDEQARHLFLMVHGGGQRAALRIDSFIESREVVVKSLGLQLSGIRSMMGATIMGNGNVVLILDIPALLRMHVADAQNRLQNDSLPEETAPLQQEIHHHVTTVMVVDDSITVRKVTSRLLERHNMKVIIAKDGIDALEVLQHNIPDVMLLDIEMPRMDGFELASVIRNEDRLKHIPIIMITSRTGDKHRDHAIRIGVNMYLGKPYQEDVLMEHIYSFVKSNQTQADLSLVVQ